MTTPTPGVLEPTTGLLRWVRGSVVGAAATVLAWGAHLSAGGADPGPPVLLVLATVAGAAGVLLSGRRRRLPGLLAMAVAGQAGLHLSMTVAAAAHLGPAGGMTGMMTPGMSGAPDAVLPGGWLMPAAHLLVAAVTSVLLLHGESWLWRLVVLVQRTLLTVRLVPVILASRWRQPIESQPGRPRVSVLVDGLARRGPPPWTPSPWTLPS